MRVPATERNTASPLLIVVGAVALALCAMILLRSGTHTAALAAWSENPGIPQPQSATGKVAASPAPSATPAPIHARVGLQVGHWKSAELPMNWPSCVPRPVQARAASMH